jgi:hypothetical protein
VHLVRMVKQSKDTHVVELYMNSVQDVGDEERQEHEDVGEPLVDRLTACICWIDLHPGSVKPSPGLPLPLPQRPDRGHPTRYWAVGPRRQRLYKWAREPRFDSQSNPILSPIPISGGARQRRKAPLLPPPELMATAGSGAMESSSSSSKTQGM